MHFPLDVGCCIFVLTRWYFPMAAHHRWLSADSCYIQSPYRQVLPLYCRQTRSGSYLNGEITRTPHWMVKQTLKEHQVNLRSRRHEHFPTAEKRLTRFYVSCLFCGTVFAMVMVELNRMYRWGEMSVMHFHNSVFLKQARTSAYKATISPLHTHPFICLLPNNVSDLKHSNQFKGSKCVQTVNINYHFATR